MRKFISLILLLVLIFCLSGCQSSDSVVTDSSLVETDSTISNEQNKVDTSSIAESTVPSKESTIDNLVKKFNKTSTNSLTFFEKFKVSDKESGHYRTEFRLNAYEDAIGKSYKMNDLIVDFITTENYSGKIDVRIYSDGASLEQCVEIIQYASPLLDTTMDKETLNKTVSYVKEEKEANGYYFGKLGLLLLGNEQSGFKLMLETD